MTDQHSLIMGFYAGVAGVILLAGFLYKKFRDHRDEQRTPKTPKLPFPKTPKREHDHEHDHVHAATV